MRSSLIALPSFPESDDTDFENSSIAVRYRSRVCAEDAFTARLQVAKVIVATRITSRKRSVGVVGRKESWTTVATSDTGENEDVDARAQQTTATRNIARSGATSAVAEVIPNQGKTVAIGLGKSPLSNLKE